MTFLKNNLEPDHDPATKQGIVFLSIFLLLLIGFFIWYNFNFSPNKFATDSSVKKTGFFSDLLSKNTQNNSVIDNDTDHDGLSDEVENRNNTDTSKIDTDNDGLTDGEEVNVYKTNPLQADTDGDGSNDGEEIKNRRNPLDSSPAAVWPPIPSSLISIK